MALPPRNHRITLEDAAAHTRRHRKAHPRGVKSFTFAKGQVLKLLGQPGCVGLRVHLGRTATGKQTLVLSGVDRTGADQVHAVLLNDPSPCPPYCGPGTALNS